MWFLPLQAKMMLYTVYVDFIVIKFTLKIQSMIILNNY